VNKILTKDIRFYIYCNRFYISEWLFIVTDFIYQSG